MPDLDSILKETMFITADSAGSNVDLGTSGTFNSPTPPDQKGFSGPVEDRPVWSWDHDARNLGDKTSGIGSVQNLQCFVRSMGHLMPVCTEIEWRDLEVQRTDSNGTARRVNLPLQRQFLIRRRFLRSGDIPDSSTGFWRLKAKVDSSLMLVFAYEVDFNAGQAKPVGDPDNVNSPCTVCTRPNFMSENAGKAGEANVPVGSDGEIRVAPTRVVVSLQLICCKERQDFDPAKVLGAGRLYPLMMVMSNLPFDNITGGVTIVRPPKTAHTQMFEPDLIAPILVPTDTMTPDIGCAFFTDNNSNPVVVPIFWNDFFDYYLIDPSPGTVVAVDPAITTIRMKDKTKKRIGLGDIKVGISIKLPRQAEFDNIHVAPKMVAPRSTPSREATMDGIA